MKFYKSILTAFASVAVCFSASAAGNTINIGTQNDKGDWTFSITPGLQTYAPVMVDFEDQVGALQFDLVLPPNVSLTKNVIKNTELVPASDNIVISSLEVKDEEGKVIENENEWRVMLVAARAESLIKTSGVLMQLEFDAKTNAFDLFPQLPLEMKNIVLTSANGKEDYNVSADEDYDTIIEIGIEHLSLTSPMTETENIIYPGVPMKVSLGMDNTVEAAGLQAYITLPEGVTIDPNSFEFTDRGIVDGSVSERTLEMFNDNPREWTLLVYRFDGKPAINGYNGVFCTFDVIADENIAKEGLDIDFTNFEISYGTQTTLSFSGEGLNIKLVNGNNVYDSYMAQVADLRAELAKAVAEIAESCPLVAEDFNGDYVEGYINQLEQQINVGVKEGTLQDIDMVKLVADIQAMIVKYVDDAKAQEIAVREENNEAAYNEVIAVLDDVQAQYEAALASLKEEYPAVDFAEWEEMISGQIEEQRNGAAQALAAANEDGVEFSYPFDNGEYILTMIEEMKNYAKASADQAALEAANAEACNAVLATIDGLQADFEAAVAEVKESYPDFEVAEYEEIVMGMLNQAREGAAQALAAANEDGVEFEFAYTGEDVQAVIEEMKTVAAREAANEAAYNDVIATIDALQAEYEAAVAEIKESHPDFDFTQWDEDIMGALNQAREGAAQALAAANEDGADFFFPYDGEDVKGMIEEMKNSVEGSAVEAIEAAVAAGKAKIFTLDGKQHNRPVVGEVNVIVRENSVSKIVIK